jgi:hypothetical protein
MRRATIREVANFEFEGFAETDVVYYEFCRSGRVKGCK